MIDYLDLKIYEENGKLNTIAFFKQTDCNGYIPTRSYHHPKWIGNIPKGQLIRIHRNCSNQSDYAKQCKDLWKKVIIKTDWK